MKNNKYIHILLTIMFVIVACDDDEFQRTYDVNGGQTLLSFSESSYRLEVEQNATSDITIPLEATTVSNVDRTYTFSIVEDDTNANPDTYSFNNDLSVVIPAGEYVGNLIITGDDTDPINDIDEVPDTLVIQLDETNVFDVLENGTITILILQACPIPNNFFVGDYLIQDVSAMIGPGNDTENFEAGTVTLSATSSTSRSFVAGVLPAFAGDNNITLNFLCGDIVSINTVDPSLSCNGDDAYIFEEAGVDNTPYDLTNDSSITINYIEDPNGSCGGPWLSSFSLTKVE